MKLPLVVAAFAACSLFAQNPQKAPAKPMPSTANAGALIGHDSLEALQKDFREKKLAALDLYAKGHATAKDAGDALTEAVEIAQALDRHDDVMRLADTYLKAHATGDAAGSMKLARAGALNGKGDVAAAQKAYEDVQSNAGDDLNVFVEATTGLAELLVASGKKDEGVKVLNDAGEARSSVRGLKEHFARIAKDYELIGSEPTAMGQDDIAGKAIDLAEYKGKVLLIDFWATWCGPCMHELPNVIAAYEKYHSKGFEILGVSLDEDRAAFDKCIEEKKMSWRHHYDGNGWKNEIAQAYGVQSIPATYLVGPDGKVVGVGLRGDKLDKELGRLLGKALPASAPAKGK